MVQSTAANSLPFITWLCAPAFAPVEVSDRNKLIGHSLSEIWDESVLQMMSINPDEVHCPVVASTGSFSRCNNQKKPQVWIDHSMPYLFAAGESVIDMVTYEEHKVFKAIFLPKVCTLPTGIFWLTDTSYNDFLQSLACLQPAFCQVIEVFQHLEDQVCHWFEAVNKDCSGFKLFGMPLQLIIHQIFPSFTDGSYNREYIQCANSNFSPMMEMINCFLWRLQVDTHLSSSGSKDA